MALYLISYDEHNERDYSRCYDLMKKWSAQKLLESLWLANLRGPAEVVRDIVLGTFDHDASVAVIELEPTAEWATVRCQEAGVNWLWQHIPFRV